jgi:hypothetical protein
MTCAPKSDGSAPSAAEFVAQSQLKSLGLTQGRSQGGPTQGGSDTLSAGALWGLFYRQIPASACGGTSKGIVVPVKSSDFAKWQPKERPLLPAQVAALKARPKGPSTIFSR